MASNATELPQSLLVFVVTLAALQIVAMPRQTDWTTLPRHPAPAEQSPGHGLSRLPARTGAQPAPRQQVAQRPRHASPGSSLLTAGSDFPHSGDLHPLVSDLSTSTA